MLEPFRSIAIAGAWGYIGLKFLEAARQIGMKTAVYDPGPEPPGVDLHGLERYTDEAAFYAAPADLFHLALHPEHRKAGLTTLLARSRQEPISVLCEKPMAMPGHPEQCDEVIAAADASDAVVLYDFPELFDPITQRIVDVLAEKRNLRLTSLYVQRSKDREDPANSRNYKRMVSIQYQESVHCLAFVLFVLGHARGSFDGVFANGLTATATAVSYAPPNPDAYPEPVDGRCDFNLQLGPVAVSGRTDFTRGAPWAKTRIIEGTANGRPLRIEADYLEGQKRLVIDGRTHDDVVQTDSYVEVIRTFDRWRRSIPRAELMTGHFPHPRFAKLAYQLSTVLYTASHAGQPVTLPSLAALESLG